MNANTEVLEVNLDFSAVEAGHENPQGNRTMNHKQEWMKKLPGLLRGFGALAVLVSLYSFFARGWEGSSDLIRYLMLLGHTGALAAIGLASGHFLREGKGARLLLTLALVSVVANFAILGAFIFSGIFAGQLGVYPYYLAWTIGSPMSAALISLGSLIVLIPIAQVGFLTLARGISKRMTLLFLLGNAALLIPMREPMMVAALTLAMAGMLLYWCGKSLRQNTEVKTLEGMTALALQFLPIGVLIGRNLWLYRPDAMVLTVAALAGFIALRQLSLFLDSNSRLRRISEVFSLGLAGLSGFALLVTFIDAGLRIPLSVVLATLATAAMVYELSTRSDQAAAIYRSIAVAIVVTGLGLNLYLFGGILASLLTIATGIALIAGSYMVQQRSALIGGVILFLGGLFEQLGHVFFQFEIGYWAALAILGVLAIVIGSLLESQGGNIKARLTAWKSGYKEWNY